MNANNARLASLAVVVSCLVLSSAAASAQETALKAAPALYDVREMQMQHGRLANAAASGNCGTSSGEVAAMFLNAFKADGLPVFSVMGAPAPKQGVARVDVYPDLVTVQPNDRTCISYLAISVQTRDVLRVFPVETPRNLITTYWSAGLMVTSSAPAHAVALNDAAQKLTAAFSRQYRLDQPPAMAPAPSAAQAPAQPGAAPAAAPAAAAAAPAPTPAAKQPTTAR